MSNAERTGRVGIVGLARYLGLSVSTVSRALNGYADVSASTRARVEAGALALNYAADRMGRNLRAGRTGTIGFVFSPVQGQFIDGFYAPLLSALNEGLRVRGYDLIVASAPPGPQEAALFRHLAEGRRVDALLFTRTRAGDARICYMLDQGMPFASLGGSDLGVPHPHVEIELGLAAELACARLAAFGHRRIALAHGPLTYLFCRAFRDRFVAAMAAHGLAADLVFPGDHTEAGGLAIAHRILALADRPTAVVCNNDATAIGVMQGLAAAGVAIGRQVSVIGCDNIAMAAYTSPALTSFGSPLVQIADALVDVVLAAIASQQLPPPVRVFQPALVARQSDGPPQ